MVRNNCESVIFSFLSKLYWIGSYPSLPNCHDIFLMNSWSLFLFRLPSELISNKIVFKCIDLLFWCFLLKLHLFRRILDIVNVCLKLSGKCGSYRTICPILLFLETTIWIKYKHLNRCERIKKFKSLPILFCFSLNNNN